MYFAHNSLSSQRGHLALIRLKGIRKLRRLLHTLPSPLSRAAFLACIRRALFNRNILDGIDGAGQLLISSVHKSFAGLLSGENCSSARMRSVLRETTDLSFSCRHDQDSEFSERVRVSSRHRCWMLGVPLATFLLRSPSPQRCEHLFACNRTLLLVGATCCCCLSIVCIWPACNRTLLLVGATCCCCLSIVCIWPSACFSF